VINHLLSSAELQRQRDIAKLSLRQQLRNKNALRSIAANLDLARRIVKDHAHCAQQNCWLCGLPILISGECGKFTYSDDHVLPRANGGSNHHTNLRPAHRRCNTIRGTKEPDETLALRLRMGVLVVIRQRVSKDYF